MVVFERAQCAFERKGGAEMAASEEVLKQLERAREKKAEKDALRVENALVVGSKKARVRTAVQMLEWIVTNLERTAKEVEGFRKGGKVRIAWVNMLEYYRKNVDARSELFKRHMEAMVKEEAREERRQAERREKGSIEVPMAERVISEFLSRWKNPETGVKDAGLREEGTKDGVGESGISEKAS